MNQHNTKYDEFVFLYTQNEKHIPALLFKEGRGDLKTAIENTVNQFADIDPIDPQIIAPGSTGQTDTEPYIKEDVVSTGETIISDNDDDIITRPMRADDAPAGVEVSTEEAIDSAGLATFNIPYMDDFLGENEGTANEDKETTEEIYKEIANREMCKYLHESNFNEMNSSIFKEASEVLATKIGTVYHTFKTQIVPEVKELQSKIIEETNTMLHNNGSAQLAESLEIESPTIKMINWNLMNTLGSKDEIIAGAKSLGKLKMTDVMNFNASRSTTRMWAPRLEEVDIPDAVGDTIVKKVATEVGENVEEAGIITASNPDTPEGQVASGEAYIKRIFSKATESFNLETDGNFEADTTDTDKQAFAHSPEEALEEAKEVYHTAMVDRKLSGGVRLGNVNLYQKFMDSMSNISNSDKYDYLNIVNVHVLDKADTNYLPRNEFSLFNKHLAFKMFQYFKDNVLNVKNLIVKLKHIGIESSADPADINSISNTAKQFHDELNQLLKTDVAKTDNIFTTLYNNINKTTLMKSGWMTNDVQRIMRYKDVFNSYRAFKNDIETIYKMEALKDTNQNKVFNYGYYMLETINTLFSTIYSATMSTCMTLVKGYELGVINSYDKLGTNMILTPMMDDFLGEDEGTDKDNKDGDDHLESDDSGIEGFKNWLNNTNIEIGKEDLAGIIRTIVAKLKQIFKNIVNFFKSIWNKIVGWFNNYERSIKNKIKVLEQLKNNNKGSINYNESNNPKVFTIESLESQILFVKNAIKENMFNALHELFDGELKFEWDKRLPDQLEVILNKEKESQIQNLGMTNVNLNENNMNITYKTADNVLTILNLCDTHLIKQVNRFNEFINTIENRLPKLIYEVEKSADGSEAKQKADAAVENMKSLQNIFKNVVSKSIKLIQYSLNIANQYEKAASDNSNEKKAEENFNYSGFNDLVISNEGIFSNISNFFNKIRDNLNATFTNNDEILNKLQHEVTPEVKNALSKIGDLKITVANKNIGFKYMNACMQSSSLMDKFVNACFKGVNENRITKEMAASGTALFSKYTSTFGNETDWMKIVDQWEASEVSTVISKCGYDFNDVKTIKNFNDNISKFVTIFNKYINNADANPNKLQADSEDMRQQYINGAISIFNMCLIYLSVIRDVAKSIYKLFLMCKRNAGTESSSITREVYNIVSKHSGYYNFARKLNNAMRAMNTGHQVPEMLRVVNKYPKVLQKLATMDFGISLNDGAAIKNNANAVREMLNCVGLHLLVCKQYFDTNNVLLLDATHANPDTFEEFKKQDGSMEDINLHLLHRYILPKQTVPNMGIRISEILRNKQSVAIEHMKRTESIKDTVRINHDGASILAYTRVLSDYLKELPMEYIPKGMTRQNFINMKYPLVKATSRYLNSKDHSIDECLYKFLLKLKYNDSPMYQDMYNKMEIQYRRLAESAESAITPSDKATADAKVVSDIVMNFLFDYFVER